MNALLWVAVFFLLLNSLACLWRVLAGPTLADRILGVNVVATNTMVVLALLALLLEQGFDVEVLACFEPRLNSIGAWWQQLFGESEGKEHTGLFPAAVQYSTDLHSLGQYLQEGRRNVLETFLMAERDEGNLTVPEMEADLDKLAYLEGETFTHVNRRAYEGTVQAHHDGGVPTMTFWIDAIKPPALGELLYVFEHAVAVDVRERLAFGMGAVAVQVGERLGLADDVEPVIDHDLDLRVVRPDQPQRAARDQIQDDGPALGLVGGGPRRTEPRGLKGGTLQGGVSIGADRKLDDAAQHQDQRHRQQPELQRGGARAFAQQPAEAARRRHSTILSLLRRRPMTRNASARLSLSGAWK